MGKTNGPDFNQLRGPGSRPRQRKRATLIERIQIANDAVAVVTSNQEEPTDTYDLLADLMHWVAAQNDLNWEDCLQRSEVEFRSYQDLSVKEGLQLVSLAGKKSAKNHQLIKDEPEARVARLGPIMEQISAPELIAALRYRLEAGGPVNWEYVQEQAAFHFMMDRDAAKQEEIDRRS